MPYTSNKRYSVQSATSNPGTWGAGGTTGDDLNTGVMGLLDTQLAAVVTNSVSSSNVDLTYANVQSCMFRFTGTLLANIVVAPLSSGSPVAATYFLGFYYFENVTSGSFTITLTTSAGSVALPQGRRGVLFVDAVNGPRIVAIVGSSTADPVPAGSKTIWYNTAAPSGWTAVALNDYAIKIVTAGSGGVTSGSVAYSTLFARTATDSHTLTTAQIPSHTHSVPNSIAGTTFGASGTFFTNANGSTLTSGNVTGATGGGDGHTHNLDMRVNTAAFSLATRD